MLSLRKMPVPFGLLLEPLSLHVPIDKTLDEKNGNDLFLCVS